MIKLLWKPLLQIFVKKLSGGSSPENQYSLLTLELLTMTTIDNQWYIEDTYIAKALATINKSTKNPEEHITTTSV